jgi:hypothetical protein
MDCGWKKISRFLGAANGRRPRGGVEALMKEYFDTILCQPKSADPIPFGWSLDKNLPFTLGMYLNITYDFFESNLT